MQANFCKQILWLNLMISFLNIWPLNQIIQKRDFIFFKTDFDFSQICYILQLSGCNNMSKWLLLVQTTDNSTWTTFGRKWSDNDNVTKYHQQPSCLCSGSGQLIYPATHKSIRTSTSITVFSDALATKQLTIFCHCQYWLQSLYILNWRKKHHLAIFM